MIYFIYSESGHVKIGFTNNLLEYRMKAMQIGNPFKLTLLKTIDGDQPEEYMLHKYFSKCHFRGEWFIFNDDIKEFLNNPSYEKLYKNDLPIIRDGNNCNINRWILYNLMKQGHVSKSELSTIVGLSYEKICKIFIENIKLTIDQILSLSERFKVSVELLTDNQITRNDIKDYVPSKKYLVIRKHSSYPDYFGDRKIFKEEYRFIQYLKKMKRYKVESEILISAYIS
jgi:plasmid maintenance system antidote protein VapI